MNKNKKLKKKGVVVAAAAAMITGVVPSVNAFAMARMMEVRVPSRRIPIIQQIFRIGYPMSGRAVKALFPEQIK